MTCPLISQSRSNFTKLDLRSAVYANPVKEADILKTAVTIPFGMFEFLWMPFVLMGSSNTFQRLMDEVFWGIDNAYSYVNDILITSHTKYDHYKPIEAVFNRIHAYGLIINMANCKYVQSKLAFLGRRDWTVARQSGRNKKQPATNWSARTQTIPGACQLLPPICAKRPGSTSPINDVLEGTSLTEGLTII